MNLISVKRRMKELNTFMSYQQSEIVELRNTVKATQYEKDLVQGSHKRTDTSDVIAKVVEMEKELRKAQEEYDRLVSLINQLEEGYKLFNDRDKLIYLEYYCKGYSAIKIGMRYGITDRQVRKIVRNIEKSISQEKKYDIL